MLQLKSLQRRTNDREIESEKINFIDSSEKRLYFI